MTYLYIETDGEVYLIEENGVLTFPTTETSLSFKIEKKHKMNMEEDVVYCKPILDSHPSWTFKDNIPKMDNVSKIVREAINLSLVRHISSAIIIKDKKVLILKSNRGMAKGCWHWPGGFVDYGSSPEESAIRECMEELRVKVKIKELVGVLTRLPKKHHRHYAIFIPYLAEIIEGEITPQPEEVAEARWMTVDEAFKIVKNDYVIWTLNKIKHLL